MPTGTACGAVSCVKEPAMAKRKGNREARKPKQNKEKEAQTSTVSELIAKAASPSKRR